MDIAPKEIKVVLQLYQHRMRQVGKDNVKAMWKWSRFVTISSEGKVDDICRYIITRMLVENEPPILDKEPDVDNVEIYLCTASGTGVQELDHGYTLAEVYEQRWNIKRPLHLLFAIDGDIKFRNSNSILEKAAALH